MHADSYADRAIHPPLTSGKHSLAVKVCAVGPEPNFPEYHLE